MQPRSVYSQIAGTGSYLPDKIVTNADLEKMVDTTSAWILERTGIERRHIVAPEQSTLDMVEHAARRAYKRRTPPPKKSISSRWERRPPRNFFRIQRACCKSDWESAVHPRSRWRPRASDLSMQ